MAFYDETRDAVVVQLQSGTEVAVMDLDEADGFADEVKAAARKQSTGYEDFFAQQNDTDDTASNSDSDAEADTEAAPGEDMDDEVCCPACSQPRPYAVSDAAFLPETVCPTCGHVAPVVETEQGNYLISLTDSGDIAITDEHGNSVDIFRLDNALPTEEQDWGHYASALGVTRSRVRAAVEALVAAEDSAFELDRPNPSYGSDEPDEQTLMDADEALRALNMDIITESSTQPSTQPDAGADAQTSHGQGACILTGEPGENDDDCTTHDHE